MAQVGDIIPDVKDYSRSQNLSDARAIRAISTATGFVFSHIGVPQLEKESSFLFFDDQYKYASSYDFGEPISIRFDNDQLNSNSRFGFRPGELLWERVKFLSSTTKLWGTYTALASPQLYVLAKNSVSGTPIDTFDFNNDVNWTASDDASNITTDLYTKKEGAASLRFDTTVNVVNRASLTRTISAFDMSGFQDLAYFKCWAYLPNVTNFTSVSFNWGNDSSNYFKKTVTAQEDGTPFAVGWNALSFQWLGATQVGTINTSLITFIKFNFDYTAGFTPAVYWRLDYLRASVPDKMIYTYYSKFRGTNAAGTPIKSFSATTDVFYTDDDDVLQLIKIQAAIILNPQIIVEDKSVRQLYSDYSMLVRRRYPRKKVNNLLAEPPMSQTSS